MKAILLVSLFLNLLSSANAQTRLLDTTFRINGQPLRISTKDIDQNFMVLISHYASQVALYDTISWQGLADIKFPDFNNDNYPDILLTHYGNNPTYYLYLFDSNIKHFKNIPNYMSFPDAVQLKSNPNYYYSYHRAGCADMTWVSDMFKIVDFKIIQTGHIIAEGCDPNNGIIQVYKVINNDREKKYLISKLPYLKTLKKYDNKWDFIEKYWNKNFRTFN